MADEEKTERSVEELFERLGEVIASLEEGEVSLDQSFLLYEEGMKLLKESNERIDMVEKRVLALSKSGELVEFGEDSDDI